MGVTGLRDRSAIVRDLEHLLRVPASNRARKGTSPTVVFATYLEDLLLHLASKCALQRQGTQQFWSNWSNPTFAVTRLMTCTPQC